MVLIRKWMSFVALACVAAVTFGEVDWKSNPIQSGVGHRALVGDYSGGKVCVINEAGQVEWEFPVKSPNDAWMLPNGNVLVNNGDGVLEVTPAKAVVFEYATEGEIYTCQRLPNGNTFIGNCTEGELIEVDPAGVVVKKLTLPSPSLPENATKPKARARALNRAKHSYMRDARKLENGNYLVSHIGQGVVREYDSSGTIVREILAPAGPHSAIRLPNGNTLISCGDKGKGPKVIEVDPVGAVVWKLEADELPGIPLVFMTGLQRLPNGNTVMTNWLGHGKERMSAHIIEVTPEKHVVWTHQGFDAIQTASCIQVLDVSGNAIFGDVFR